MPTEFSSGLNTFAETRDDNFDMRNPFPPRKASFEELPAEFSSGLKTFEEANKYITPETSPGNNLAHAGYFKHISPISSCNGQIGKDKPRSWNDNSKYYYDGDDKTVPEPRARSVPGWNDKGW